MSTLESLPNIGKDTASQLEAIGITTFEQLREVGSREAWLRIQHIVSLSPLRVRGCDPGHPLASPRSGHQSSAEGVL